MRRTTCFLLALGFLLYISAGAFAQPGKGPRGFGGQFPGGFGKKKFDDVPGIPSNDPGPPKITRWEYRIETGPSGTNAEALNKLGNEGWELVGIESRDKGPSRYVFRRQLAGHAKVDVKPATDPTTKEKADVKTELRTYVMKHANANDVAAVLSDVLRITKNDSLRIVAEPRTNQIIVNGSMEKHAEIAGLLQSLDTPDVSSAAPGGKKSPKTSGGK